MLASLSTRLIALYADAEGTARQAFVGPIARFARDQSGVTAVEYGMIVAGIALAIVGVVYAMGNDFSAYYQAIDSRLTSRTPT